MTIREHFGMSAVRAAKTKLPLLEGIVIKSEHLIGIEVEVENVGIAKDFDTTWTTTDDGSLRNRGVEFVSKPIPASLAPTLLNNLLVDSLSKTCSFSPRTSVHIHLDMQTATASQVVDFLGMYCLFEKLLYQYAGRRRNKNIYCVPISETRLATGFAHNSIQMISDWRKYTGLNLLPLASYGTVEFRHMHGTFDVAKLCGWIQLIVLLKDFVLNSTDLKKRILSMDAATSWQPLVEEVFGEHSKLLTIKNPSEFLAGLMTAKSMYFNINNATSLRRNLSDYAPITLKQ